MPAQRNFHRYPARYANYFERAADGEDVVLDVPTEQSATITRNELYNFRYAIRKEMQENPNESLEHLSEKAERLSFAIEPTHYGWRVRIYVPKGLKYL